MPEDKQRFASHISVAKAKENGLTCRELKGTMKDIFAWWHSDAVDEERRSGFLSNKQFIMPREEGILKKWKERQ